MASWKNKNPYFRIRELRENRGIRQCDFARALNYTQAQICNIEHGYTMPNVMALPKIARVLGCTVDYLYRPEVLR